MTERKEAGRENQEDQPEKQEETHHSTMSSHARRRVFRDGTSDQDVPSLKQDGKGVLILVNGKSLANSDLMLSLTFCPKKVSIMGVF